MQVGIEANKWYKEMKRTQQMSLSNKNTYRAGMVSKVGLRLAEITRGHMEYNGEKGLVVLNDSISALDKVDEFMKGMRIGKGSGYGGKIDSNSYGAGHSKGDSISLNRRLSSPQTRTLRIGV